MPPQERFRHARLGRASSAILWLRNFPFRSGQRPKLANLFLILIYMAFFRTNPIQLLAPDGRKEKRALFLPVIFGAMCGSASRRMVARPAAAGFGG